VLGLDPPANGAPVDPSVPLNRSERDALPPWSDWRDEQCLALERICGASMRDYGYGREPAWLARVAAAPGGDPGSNASEDAGRER
jgi:hypothetical protein